MADQPHCDDEAGSGWVVREFEGQTASGAPTLRVQVLTADGALVDEWQALAAHPEGVDYARWAAQHLIREYGHMGP